MGQENIPVSVDVSNLTYIHFDVTIPTPIIYLRGISLVTPLLWAVPRVWH
jgi:hypothetical protein